MVSFFGRFKCAPKPETLDGQSCPPSARPEALRDRRCHSREKLEDSLGKSLFQIHAQGRAAIILRGLANIIDDVGEFAHGSWLIVTQWQSPPSRPYSP